MPALKAPPIIVHPESSDVVEFSLEFAHGRPRFGTKPCMHSGCTLTAVAELRKRTGAITHTAYLCYDHAKKIEEDWKDREEHGY